MKYFFDYSFHLIFLSYLFAYLHKELGASFLPTYVNKFEFFETFNLKEKERINNLE
jgi:hypothetical protein